MHYKVVIIEDEKHQQERLLTLLKPHAEFVLSGIADSVEQGKLLLNDIQPDLVFLDVMLPPFTSFDLLHSLSAIPFDVIFITSYEEYAVKAFRLSAIDYLMKPTSEDEFTAALEKFKQKKISPAEQIKNLLSNLPPQANVKIALPTMTGFLYIPVKDIIRCESDNTYTTFFTTDKRKIIVSKTLKEVEQMLVDYKFYRVHNSHLVNIDFIIEYIKGEGGIVKMSDGSHVDVSRRRKEGFLKQLK